MQPLFSTTASNTPSSTSSNPPIAPANGKGLSGGQIAGIVVGSVVGAGVLLALLVCCCLVMRRRHNTNTRTSLNQPTPIVGREKTSRKSGLNAIPGARVTRMAAIEQDSNNSPSERTNTNPSSRGIASAGVAEMTARGHPGKVPPVGLDESSPESQGYSSGDGGGTGQSEQLDSFKDYYSNDEIHPGDLVSTLWAYAPRANDEFELERGDMLRIVGIWDDGWATGIRIHQRADQWEPERNTQRDSGVSGGTAQEPPPRNGDVKAFPVSLHIPLPNVTRSDV